MITLPFQTHFAHYTVLFCQKLIKRHSLTYRLVKSMLFSFPFSPSQIAQEFQFFHETFDVSILLKKSLGHNRAESTQAKTTRYQQKPANDSPNIFLFAWYLSIHDISSSQYHYLSVCCNTDENLGYGCKSFKCDSKTGDILENLTPCQHTEFKLNFPTQYRMTTICLLISTGAVPNRNF